MVNFWPRFEFGTSQKNVTAATTRSVLPFSWPESVTLQYDGLRSGNLESCCGSYAPSFPVLSVSITFHTAVIASINANF
jgi:hypothetical protein